MRGVATARRALWWRDGKGGRRYGSSAHRTPTHAPTQTSVALAPRRSSLVEHVFGEGARRDDERRSARERRRHGQIPSSHRNLIEHRRSARPPDARPTAAYPRRRAVDSLARRLAYPRHRLSQAAASSFHCHRPPRLRRHSSRLTSRRRLPPSPSESPAHACAMSTTAGADACPPASLSSALTQRMRSPPRLAQPPLAQTLRACLRHRERG